MLKHILKMIKAQGRENAWVFTELLVVFVLLWWSVDTWLMQGITAHQPEGFSVDNVCKLTLAARPESSAAYIPYEKGSDEMGDNFLRIVDRIRTHPDVEAVTYCTAFSSPFTYASGQRMYWNDTVRSAVGLTYDVTPDYFRVFDIHTADGGSPSRLSEALSGGWIISKTLADNLSDGEQLLGKPLAFNKGDSTTYRVVGITAPIKKQGFDQPRPITFSELTEQDIRHSGEQQLTKVQISFRLRPGVKGSTEYAEAFKKEMKQGLAVGNFWLADVQYYPDIRHRFLDNSMQMNGRRLVVAVNVFLLVNVFLAVIGLFWFRVSRRKGEIGLRMAIGSTRRGVRSLTMGEGLLILTLIAIPALLICLNMAYIDLLSTEVMKVTFARLAAVSLLTWCILALVIILATWYPSHKAARLEPAEALHYE